MKQNTKSGSKTTRIKFKSAEEKRQYLENQASWEKLKERHGVKQTKGTRGQRAADKSTLVYSLSNPPGRDRLDIPSRDSGVGIAVCNPTMKYTGNLVRGISVVHKSCLQPVFTDEQAKEFAGMRR